MSKKSSKTSVSSPSIRESFDEEVVSGTASAVPSVSVPSGTSFSGSSVSSPSVVNDLFQIGQALQIKAPFLSMDFSKSSVKTFLSAYNRYKLSCATVNAPVRPVQVCLLPEQIEIILK